MKKEIICLLELLRYGLRKTNECTIPLDVNWNDLFNLSMQQGVDAIVLDGINRCFNNGQTFDIDFEIKMDWIDDVRQLESIYSQHKKIVKKLAKLYQSHEIRMLLLKGIGLSKNYPIPQHRPCGDIDVYLFGELEKGDKLIQDIFGIDIDRSQHKHTVFQLEDATIENHYDFVNYHKYRSSKELDVWLKINCRTESIESIDLGANVYLPSPNFNAIFLVRHAASHFAAEQITLRHILDWAFFVEKHYEEVDWDWQWKICRRQNMDKFLLAINNICVQYLGFETSKFKTDKDAVLTERILNEILSPAYQDNELERRSLYTRLCKWWNNRWKHKIVYPESLTSAFIHQIYAHLMKPATLHS